MASFIYQYINKLKSLLIHLLVALISLLGNTHISSAADSASAQIKTGTVTGRFTVQDGGSMAGGQVMFYSGGNDPPPNITRYMRIPNLIVDINEDGFFLAEIPEGKFYLRAIKRNSEKQTGKPVQGDYFFRYQEIDSFQLKECSIKEGDHIDFGILKAQLFTWDIESHALSSKTAIKGTLREPDGTPFEDGIVFAYPTPQMQGSKPLFISLITDKNGHYTLHTPPGGPYYLLARDVIGGGQVAEGAIIGQFGIPQPIGISLQEGEIRENVDFEVIRMRRRGPVPEPGGTRKDLQNKIDAGNP